LHFCWCVSTIGWHRYVGKMVQGFSDAEFADKVTAIPVVEQQVKWRRAREGFPQGRCSGKWNWSRWASGAEISRAERRKFTRARVLPMMAMV
jgi:hypothetical protein